MTGLLDFIPIIGKAADRLLGLIPDKSQDSANRHQIELILTETVAAATQGQIQANIEQTRHSSIFVAGARPAFMWILAVGFAWQIIIHPIWVWVSLLCWPQAPLPPSLDQNLMEMVLAMLGLSGWRTLEKIKGVARQ